MTGLRPVVDDEHLAVLRILADRRRALGEEHTRKVNGLFTVEGVVAGWMVAGASVPG